MCRISAFLRVHSAIDLWSSNLRNVFIALCAIVRHRWENDIKVDIKLGGHGIHLAANRYQLWPCVSMVMNFGLHKMWAISSLTLDALYSQEELYSMKSVSLS